MIKSKLKILLFEKGLTIKALSDLTGINRYFIQNLCNNKVKDLSLEYLSKICEVLECQPSDILVFEKKTLILKAS